MRDGETMRALQNRIFPSITVCTHFRLGMGFACVCVCVQVVLRRSSNIAGAATSKGR